MPMVTGLVGLLETCFNGQSLPIVYVKIPMGLKINKFYRNHWDFFLYIIFYQNRCAY